MDVERDFKKMLSEILEKDERYSVNAYVFIRHALDYTLITMGINMVDAALLGKTEEDSIEDFDDGYDFSEAFEKPFK